MSPLTRPVLALDVDGVVNADVGEERPVTISAAGQPDSPFFRSSHGVDVQGSVFLVPGVGAWIRQMLEVADVVWATTWEDLANEVVAPLLGIDPLPVACRVAEHPPKFGWVRNGNPEAWKADVLAQRFAGRPLAWVDDLAWAYDLRRYGDADEGARVLFDWRATRGSAPAPTLVVVPDERVGLTEAEMGRIGRFLTDPAGFTD